MLLSMVTPGSPSALWKVNALTPAPAPNGPRRVFEVNSFALMLLLLSTSTSRTRNESAPASGSKSTSTFVMRFR